MHARPTYPAISRFLPFTQLCRFVYTETVSINPAANPSGSTEKLIYPMQVNDPLNHDDSVHQPAQWSEALDHYQYGTVQSCKATFRRVLDGSNASYCYWGAAIDETTYPKYDFVGMSHDELTMMAGVPHMKFSAATGAFNPGTNKGAMLVKYFKPTKFYRTTKKELNKKG